MSTVTKRNILLVEDIDSIRTLMAHLLRRAGYNVVEAEGGREAWHRIQEQAPDLLITDRQMAGGDGIALAIQARESDQTFPIIFMCSEQDEKSMEIIHGITPHLLLKPVSPKQLLEKVHEVLHQKAA